MDSNGKIKIILNIISFLFSAFKIKVNIRNTILFKLNV